MKNQRMILPLAGVTMGIIVVLFVIDFVVPGRQAMSGLVGRERASLFGRRVLPREPRGEEDPIKGLRARIDLVSHKLDRVIEMIEDMDVSGMPEEESAAFRPEGHLVTPFMELQRDRREHPLESRRPEPRGGTSEFEKMIGGLVGTMKEAVPVQIRDESLLQDAEKILGRPVSKKSLSLKTFDFEGMPGDLARSLENASAEAKRDAGDALSKRIHAEPDTPRPEVPGYQTKVSLGLGKE